jgi:uncharacterized RDD family membrane protein YckC
MNCPTCGLLNIPTAQVCIHCKCPLDSSNSHLLASKNVVTLHKAKAAIDPMEVQNPISAEDEDWRQQLNLRLEQIKEKNSGPEINNPKEIVETFRNREFIRPGHEQLDESSSPMMPVNRGGYHPLAQKTLQKLDRVQRGNVTLPAVEPLGGSKNHVPEVQSFPAKKVMPRTPAKKPERTERIEIDLNQGTLPFDSFQGHRAASPEDLIKNGITAASLTQRIRAGAIDGLYITGCFLFFMLIVLFIPDFKLLTKPSLLGMMIVWMILFVSYHYLFISLGGRTLGVEYEHLQVVNFDGHPISGKESRLRTLGYFISLGCFGLGYLWAVFDPDRLTWHDKISKTLVVDREEADKPRLF